MLSDVATERSAGAGLAHGGSFGGPLRLARRQTAAKRVSALLVELTPGFWVYVDLLVTVFALAFTGWLSARVVVEASWGAHFAAGLIAFPAAVVVAGTICGLYEQQTFRSRSRIAVRTGASILIAMTLGYAVLCLILGRHPNPWLPAAIGLINVSLGAALRLLAYEAATTTPVRVLFLGAGASIATMIDLLSDAHDRHYNLRGYLLTDRGGAVARCRRRLAVLGTIDHILDVVRDEQIDEVVVDAALAHDQHVGGAIVACLHERCRVTDQPTFHERLLRCVPVGDITSQWFLVSNVQTSSGYDLLKRTLDLFAALLCLLLTLPLWPFIVLAIRAESKGSAFFRQTRVGLHGQPFTMLKFRTMRTDAECDGPRWAAKNDSRITRIGRFLRRTRLDELPQLLNVLRGEMTIVGPRPERPEFVETLAREIPHYHQRHLIRPGVTGWAQINLGYGASVEAARQKLCYDLFYLKHRSIDMDIAILLRTLRKFMDGAR